MRVNCVSGKIAPANERQRPVLRLRLSGDAEAEHAVTLKPDLHGFSFVVEVTPPPAGIGHDRAFNHYRAARRYALELMRAHGWPFVDLTDGRFTR